MPWGQISCASWCLFYSRHLSERLPPKTSLPKEQLLGTEGNATELKEFETFEVK